MSVQSSAPNSSASASWRASVHCCRAPRASSRSRSRTHTDTSEAARPGEGGSSSTWRRAKARSARALSWARAERTNCHPAPHSRGSASMSHSATMGAGTADPVPQFMPMPGQPARPLSRKAPAASGCVCTRWHLRGSAAAKSARYAACCSASTKEGSSAQRWMPRSRESGRSRCSAAACTPPSSGRSRDAAEAWPGPSSRWVSPSSELEPASSSWAWCSPNRTYCTCSTMPARAMAWAVAKRSQWGTGSTRAPRTLQKDSDQASSASSTAGRAHIGSM
mmetsp:Transcript_87002/g.241281  ORF Transcript_87002/g.241281 Transcript_87002/m.241281 type:complete len:278 (+) Transcript_87002:376-1209(+)